MTEVISCIETEKQTDCHVVKTSRNELSARHYEGSMTEVIS
jgi:hypothetical protein